MKKLFSFALIAVFVISCLPEQVEVKKERLPRIAYTSIESEPTLASALESIGLIGKRVPGARVMSGLKAFQPDSIIKVLQGDSANYTYTLAVDAPSLPKTALRNMVFSKVNGGFVAFVVDYLSATPSLNLSAFTGTIKRYDLQGELMSSTEMLQGVPVSKTTGGRANCVEVVMYREHPNGGDCSESVELAAWDNCYWVIEIRDCGGGGNGSGGVPGTYVPSTGVGSGSGDSGAGGSGGGGAGSTGGYDGGRYGFDDSDPIGVRDRYGDVQRARQDNFELNSGLSSAELIFLNNYQNIRSSIFLYLESQVGNGSDIEYPIEATAFAVELVQLAHQTNDAELAGRLVDITIAAQVNGYFNKSLDADFYSLIDPYVDFDLTNSEIHDQLTAYLIVRFQLIKALNPEWSDTKVFWETVKDFVHAGLDVFGLVPVIGEIGDLANGVIYTIEGDALNATLSYGSAIPFVGWGSTVTKYGLKAINAVSDLNSKVVLVWKVTADGVSFGRRSQLRTVLGLVPGDPRQAHHIIPWEFSNSPMVQKAANSSSAFHMNDFMNGVPLPTTNHLTGHQIYSSKIKAIFDDLNSSNPNMSADEAYEHIQAITKQVKEHITNNPTLNLGQIASLISYP